VSNSAGHEEDHVRVIAARQLDFVKGQQDRLARDGCSPRGTRAVVVEPAAAPKGVPTDTLTPWDRGGARRR
jgi:hypothetical protein